MKKYLLMLIACCVGLTGCLHHKSKKEKHLKSKEKKVNPVIKERHEAKQTKEKKPEVIPAPSEPSKEPEAPVKPSIIDPEDDFKKNPTSGWWPWNE